MRASLAQATWVSYGKSWDLYFDFHLDFYGSEYILPLTEQNIVYFIGFLDLRGCRPGVVASHLSAIAHKHKMRNFPDPTQSFKVRKMLSGYRKSHPSTYDRRKPISKHVLMQLLAAIPTLFPNRYSCALYRAIFSLAFYAFLRVGEYAVSAGEQRNILQFDDIIVQPLGNVPYPEIEIHFRAYKHSNGATRTIKISSAQLASVLQIYVEYRGKQPGPFFITQSSKPICRSTVASVLSTTLKYCGYDPSCYNTHSFRVGATCHAASCGMSDTQIRYMGRWQSNAFLHYIRSGEAIFH